MERNDEKTDGPVTKDYTKPAEPLKAGETCDYTIYLQPTSCTFAPCHRAVLVISACDPIIAGGDFPEENYAFTIDNGSLELRFPQAKNPAKP